MNFLHFAASTHTPEDIKEFIRLYETEFGEELTEGAARIMTNRLLLLYLELGKVLPPSSAFPERRRP